jgi:hypothetical protein
MLWLLSNVLDELATPERLAVTVARLQLAAIKAGRRTEADAP